jgi:hypothetical protein
MFEYLLVIIPYWLTFEIGYWFGYWRGEERMKEYIVKNGMTRSINAYT